MVEQEIKIWQKVIVEKQASLLGFQLIFWVNLT